MEVPARGGRPQGLAAIAALATIALVGAGASSAQAATIKWGQTQLILDQNTSSGLDARGIGILPTPPAEAVSGGEQFPISGGRVSRDAGTARINHGGGLKFVGDNARVRVKRLKVQLRDAGDSELIASLNGQRMSFLSLDGGRQTFRGRDLTFRGIKASLTRKAARTLNQAFVTNLFKKGTRLGKLRIDMKLAQKLIGEGISGFS